MSRLSLFRPVAVLLPAVLLTVCMASARDNPEAAPTDAAAALLAKLKKTPGDYLLNLKIGNLYAAQGKYANAQTHYEKAKRVAPGSLEPFYLLAVMHIQNGHYAQAEQISQEWLRRDPKSYYGHFCLADALSLRGDVKESLGVLQRLQKSYPSDTTILEAMKLRLEYLHDARGLAQVDQMIAEIKS